MTRDVDGFFPFAIEFKLGLAYRERKYLERVFFHCRRQNSVGRDPCLVWQLWRVILMVADVFFFFCIKEEEDDEVVAEVNCLNIDMSIDIRRFFVLKKYACRKQTKKQI